MMKNFFSIFLVLVIPFLTGTVSFAVQAEWDYNIEVVTLPYLGSNYGFPGELDNLFCLTYANNNTNEVELWGHDGVNPFTLVFSIPANPGGGGIPSHTEFNGQVLFAGTNGLGGYDLWEWDRTNPPTMVTTMNFTWIYNLKVYNGKVYFQGVDEIHGGELWEYDGVNQPQLVEDIYPGATSSSPSPLIVYKGKLVFPAWERWQGRELFQFDGSSVSLVADIKPGQAGSSPQTFVEFNQKLYFIAYDNDGRHIWEYDGENPPTRVTQQDCSPGELTVFGNRILFKGYDTIHEEELWAYDGVNPPALLYEINTYPWPYDYGSYPQHFTVVGDHLYFSAADYLTGRELWVYDNKKPPRLLKDFCPDAQTSNPRLYEAGGRLYIRGDYCLSGKLLMFDNVLIPEVETLAVSEVTASSATVDGDVTGDGGGEVTERGVCWSISPNPTVYDNVISSGPGTGPFTAAVTGLTPSTTYYVRTFATNSAATVYGDEMSFTTLQIVTYQLTAQSEIDGGVYITVSPADNNGSSDGTTDFTRTYNEGTTVTLTAPETIDDMGFSKWLLDGAEVTTPMVQVTMNSHHTLIAQYEPLILPPTFSVLVVNSMHIKDHAIIHSGDIGVYDASPGPYLTPGYEVTIGQSVTVADGSVIYGDSVKIKLGASVADVHYNDLDNNGTIRGSEVTPVSLPLDVTFPAFPTPAPGTQDFDIAQNETLTLESGSYGEIKVRANATLILTGGVYHLENLALGDSNSSVLFQGATDLIVNNRIEPGSAAYIGPSEGSGITANQVWIYVNGANGGSGGPSATPRAAVIGYNNQVRANFYVPNGTIWVKAGTVFEGSVTARDVLIGSNVEVSLSSGGN